MAAYSFFLLFILILYVQFFERSSGTMTEDEIRQQIDSRQKGNDAKAKLWELYSIWSAGYPAFSKNTSKSTGEDEEYDFVEKHHALKHVTDASIKKRLECIISKTKTECTRNTSKLRFLIVGDIGGLSIYPYVSYLQMNVANRMAKVAENGGIEFVMNVGDNFYFKGVTDAEDPRFEHTFENVYSAKSLEVPWYMIGGNHDHIGNIKAQQEYTKRSDLWTFPDQLWYKLRYKFGEATIDILMLDTIVLCGNSSEVKEDDVATKLDDLFKKLLKPNPEEMEVPVKKKKSYEQKAKEQLKWIKQSLNESKDATYLLVAGHYPIYSGAEEGVFECLHKTTELNQMLLDHKANVYFSGHEHNMQHIKKTGKTSEGKDITVNYVISGAGSRAENKYKKKGLFTEEEFKYRYPPGKDDGKKGAPEVPQFPLSKIGFGHGGFVLAEFEKSTAKLFFYTDDSDTPAHTVNLTARK